jgi:hypothetical protein
VTSLVNQIWLIYLLTSSGLVPPASLGRQVSSRTTRSATHQISSGNCRGA